MGGEPPTPSHVSIRGRLPSIPPFLFPLPQCSYVSFPLYFLWLRAAAERYAAPALAKRLSSSVLFPQRAGRGGSRPSSSGGVRSLRVPSVAATDARVSFSLVPCHRTLCCQRQFSCHKVKLISDRKKLTPNGGA